ncbi:MAG: DNA-binding protein, partial [Novosphingobium sp.]|nr:DNA-binding protein [Novosphingobium sp.]
MLAPRQLGLAAHGRRRTPGLRREEVAQLAGLSTTWYTWLEQGREMSMSAAALSRLADVLALSAAERDYLFQLSRRHDPRMPARANRAELPDSLRTLVDMVLAPAYVMDRLWQAQCWNGAANDLLGTWLADGEKNLLRFMFFVPSARTFISDWEDRARRVIAEFRADTAHMPEDRPVAALIGELKEGSADFARLWSDH